MSLCDTCGTPLVSVANVEGLNVCPPCKPVLERALDSARKASLRVDPAVIARRLLRENVSLSGYLLRDIPFGFWQRVRLQAVSENVTVRQLILTALERYLER